MEGFAGKVAVVTGAGSGIGQALAIELAQSGAKLAISDVDTEGLAHTEERLKATGVSVKADRLDVTEREAFSAYADAVNAHFGKVNQIYNNAGIAFTGDVESSPFKDIERVMDVDFWGVVNGTKAFLPHLIASGDGHVINMSSVVGLFAVPGQAAYNAAKFAVRGFTEALRQEMRLARPSGQGDDGASRRHQDRDRAQHATAAEGRRRRGAGADRSTSSLRTHHRSGRTGHPQGVRKNKARVLVGPDATVARRLCARRRARGCGGCSRRSCRGWCRRRATRARRRAGCSRQRVGGQPASATRAGYGSSSTPARISAIAAVSSTPATSLIASTCGSVSSLRRYSGTTFSARSATCGRPAPRASVRGRWAPRSYVHAA